MRLPVGLFRRVAAILESLGLAGVCVVCAVVLLVASLVGGRTELNDTPHLLLLLHHLDVVQATDYGRLGRRVVDLFGVGVYVEVAGGVVGV